MDPAQFTHLSLCTGYGGIDLGLRRCLPSLRTIAYAEIEAFACELLLARMEGGQLDPAPIWTDLKSFPWDQFRGLVDVLSGGYPCQPFSAAGKRLGKDDPRHLWPWIADGIRLCQPSLCFFENVEGHISLGLRDVLGELAGLGYRATWGIFSAAEVGAPHQRKRVFILAHRNDARLEGRLPSRVADPLGREEPGNGHFRPSGHHGSKLADASNSGWWQDRMPPELRANVLEQPSRHSGFADQASLKQVWPSRPGEPQHGWEPPRVVGDTEVRQDDRRESGYMEGEAGEWRRGNDAADGSGEEPHQWQTQPPLGGDVDGTSGGLDYAELCVTCDNRTDELRLLGNGVVPATAELAFRTLLNRLTND